MDPSQQGDNGAEAANFTTWPPSKKQASKAPAKAGGVSFAPDNAVVPVSPAPAGTSTPLLASGDVKYGDSADEGQALSFLTPRDEYNGAYWTFVLLGVGALHTSFTSFLLACS
jgi:hypothetical protein